MKLPNWKYKLYVRLAICANPKATLKVWPNPNMYWTASFHLLADRSRKEMVCLAEDYDYFTKLRKKYYDD